MTTATATRTPHANDRDPENDNQHDNDRDYQHDNHQDNDQDNKINNRNNKNDEENKTRWWRKRQRWRRRDDTAADNNNTMAENKNNQPENKILSIAMMLSILCIIVLESQHLFENIIVVMVPVENWWLTLRWVVGVIRTQLCETFVTLEILLGNE